MWLIDLLDDLIEWVWSHPWKTGGIACACVAGALLLRETGALVLR